jgi:hypothetical protein
MPRPPEAGGLKGLEQEVESYRTQFNLITEALNVKKVGIGRQAGGRAGEAVSQPAPLRQNITAHAVPRCSS